MRTLIQKLRHLYALPFLIAVAILYPSISIPDCAAPSGKMGQMQWIAAQSKVMVCDGTTWNATSPGSKGDTCTSADVGKIEYSSGNLQYCDGDFWMLMNGITSGPAGGAGAGTIQYSNSLNVMRFSDGTNWKFIGEDNDPDSFDIPDASVDQFFPECYGAQSSTEITGTTIPVTLYVQFVAGTTISYCIDIPENFNCTTGFNTVSHGGTITIESGKKLWVNTAGAGTSLVNLRKTNATGAILDTFNLCASCNGAPGGCM